jgi:hypothetical protein
MSEKRHKRLAEGEVTGHSHQATADDAWVVGEGDERELSAPSGTEVKHEEHGPIDLPAGDFRITRQREIDPDTEEVRVVAD